MLVTPGVLDLSLHGDSAEYIQEYNRCGSLLLMILDQGSLEFCIAEMFANDPDGNSIHTTS